MICNIIDVMEMAGCDDTLWHSINSEAEDVLSSFIKKKYNNNNKGSSIKIKRY